MLIGTYTCPSDLEQLSEIFNDTKHCAVSVAVELLVNGFYVYNSLCNCI